MKDKVHKNLGGDDHIEVVGEPLVLKVEREIEAKSGVVYAYNVGSKRYVLQNKGEFKGQYVLEKKKNNSTKKERKRNDKR